jgi:hypothetical protein
MSIRERFRIGQRVLLDGKESKVTAFSPGGNYVHVQPWAKADGTAQAAVYATSLSESEARRRIVVPGESAAKRLTSKQRNVLDAIVAGTSIDIESGLFVIRKDLGAARKLHELGLITMEDRGTSAGRDKQWLCRPAQKALTPPPPKARPLEDVEIVELCMHEGCDAEPGSPCVYPTGEICEFAHSERRQARWRRERIAAIADVIRAAYANGLHEPSALAAEIFSRTVSA